MENLFDQVRLALTKTVLIGAKQAFPQTSLSEKDVYNGFTLPPNPKMGDLALPCFPFSKILKKNPNVLAQELVLALPQTCGPYQKVHSVGPYVNFFLDPKYIGKEIIAGILSGQYFKIKLTSNAPKTMIEFSQPNTHKEIHVGHMRNLALGHSLVLLSKYAGYEVVASTYPGDVGTHVAKCLWYLKNEYKGPIPKDRKGAFLGKLYTQAYNFLEQNPKPKELSQVLSDLLKQEGEYFDLWKETRQWSISLMQDLYDWAHVKFDHWYFESQVDLSSVALAKKYLKDGLFIQSEGAIGVDLSADKLGFCMMVKSDGHGLYATKDLELAFKKFEDYKLEKSIYVVDVRQSHHFAQVFKVLEKVGLKQAKNCFHLAYDFVELPSGAMSSRKGNIIPIQELIDQMVNHITINYLEQYRGNWSDQEIEERALEISLGAINYGMLRVDPGRKIIFDMKEWLKLDGESGPYLQYCTARINSLLTKLKDRFFLEKDIPWELLTIPSETNLLYALINFNQIVFQATTNYKPSTLCSYLYDLSKLYNTFYTECPVGRASTPELGLTRYALSKATYLILQKGLTLLGIPTPKRM